MFPAEDYHTSMPEKPAGATIAYICECGKKWTFPKAEAARKEAAMRTCACGRTLVLQYGFIYSVPVDRK